MALSPAHSTAFHIKDNPHLQCSAVIKLKNITYTITCHTDQTLLMPCTVFVCKTDLIYYAQQQQHCSHPQHDSLSMHITCTTHPTAFHNLSYENNTRYTLQNGTRCRDDVNVLWCICDLMDTCTHTMPGYCDWLSHHIGMNVVHMKSLEVYSLIFKLVNFFLVSGLPYTRQLSEAILTLYGILLGKELRPTSKIIMG